MVEQEYDERLLTCQDCGCDFLYSIEDQKKDDSEDRASPSKCPRCRSGLKAAPPKAPAQRREPSRGGRGRGQGWNDEYRSPSFPQDSAAEYRGPAFADSDPSRGRSRAGSGPRSQSRGTSRQRFQITCSNCGRTDTIPFKPSPNRPVYCHECYETHKYEEKKGRGGAKSRTPGRGQG